VGLGNDAVRQFSRDRLRLGIRTPDSQCIPRCRYQLVEIDRLLEIVRRSQLQCFDSVPDVGVGGDEQAWQTREPSHDVLQKRNAVHPGHTDITDDHVRMPPLDGVPG